MESCLMVLKMAMSRLAAGDVQSRAEKEQTMREHLISCPSCASFVKALGISAPEDPIGPTAQADLASPKNDSSLPLERGHRVSLRSTPDRIGVVVSEAQWISDKPYYRVSFDPSAPAVTYALHSLQPVKDASDPLDLLTHKEFATPSEFATFLIPQKVRNSSVGQPLHIL